MTAFGPCGPPARLDARLASGEVAQGQDGLTFLELMFTLAIGATLTGIALPLAGNALDQMQTGMAARYLEGRVMLARIEALKRSAAVGLRFEASDGDYSFASYVDGNANGIRTTDVVLGIDRQLWPPERLADKYPGVRFELMAGIPQIDGDADGSLAGVRVGTAHILTMSPNGTSSSGTLYIRRKDAQYAVRVFGTTGRTRVLQYRTGEGAWISR